ncbi:TIGR03943 family protein [Cytobacillus sp. Hz8]|uniref:TIGR03943 family putative permease subunit n=1 Tax=Cytobacillus sp. Hz8 TaxID=3347168 RepID=UPI0035D8CBE3
MFRTYVLMLFTYFFFHLQASGNISKYINMKYAYVSKIAVVLLGILFLVQAYDTIRSNKEDTEELSCDCGHDHGHEKDKPLFQRWFIYFLFIFPLISGFFFPIATLDSTLVKSKGFTFKPMQQIESADRYAQTQYLRPDTSIYYGKDGYEEEMAKELKMFSAKKELNLDDKLFLKGMETIYRYPGDFLGKTVEFDGFAFNGENVDKRQVFILRFGIIHCVADSGVFGMLVEFPKDENIPDDKWLHVKGTLSSIYYQPFKSTIPVLNVNNWSSIEKPKDPYVYRGY